MTDNPTPSIIHYFSSIEDPRLDRQKKHKLQDIFFITLCAVIRGADNWVAIEEFGKAEAHRPDDKPQAKRYSRHYYDVYRMLGSYVAQVALEDVTLLDDVVAFKQKFYPSAWERYDLAQLPTLKLIPSATVKADLRKDYAAMQDMIFGEYVDFDTMMDEIAAFQERLNSMKETS